MPICAGWCSRGRLGTHWLALGLSFRLGAEHHEFDPDHKTLSGKHGLFKSQFMGFIQAWACSWKHGGLCSNQGNMGFHGAHQDIG